MGEAATASLEAVHSFGVVHGDIRLQNFILHVEGSKVMLVDFGFAFESEDKRFFWQEREELRLLLSEWMNSMSK